MTSKVLYQDDKGVTITSTSLTVRGTTFPLSHVTSIQWLAQESKSNKNAVYIIGALMTVLLAFASIYLSLVALWGTWYVASKVGNDNGKATLKITTTSDVSIYIDEITSRSYLDTVNRELSKALNQYRASHE
ncbi:hypothetical protein KQI63_16780 [bacterium]|nr:hypothetical protein [bacterium]